MNISLKRERRLSFFKQLEEAYGRLTAEELAELHAEHAEWDVSLLDGLIRD